MSGMLAAASSLLGKASSLSNYSVESPSSSSPSSSSTNLPSTSSTSTFNVGLWKVVPAKHKVTGTTVSIWMFEKRVIDGIRDVKARNGVIESLKKEVSSLSRLRHPHLLHIIEPLEETRTTLSWASESITGSLNGVLQSAQAAAKLGGKAGRLLGEGAGGAGMGGMEIDEVEIQKGVVQLAKALSFLHNQAKVVHLNVTPDSILLNATGDWKLSGLHLNQSTAPTADGQGGRYVYPEIDNRIPPQVQWNLDYLAPEYALDSSLTPANDLYSIGCILYALNVGAGKPPFRNNSSMQSLRTNVERELEGSGGVAAGGWRSGSKWEAAGQEVRDLLPRLITRTAQQRITLASLPQHPYFSSLAISTLNFLDPSNFASKPREEKASFLKGLLRVLPGFSERLRKRKVLPALLDEMKDSYLIPFILPLVFEITKSLQKEEFGPVLNKLQPLFAMKDPPQIMMTLLENLPLLEAKTSQVSFRESVMPLIYNSLESDHPPVQEKALEGVPKLCSALDYGTIENVLLVKVAILFTKTRILSVKVKTLECFLQMVPILDKSVLTTKLVPLLAKIKTKEPAVMMATLAVHEAMGARVDRAATATLVLPQLWAMSMGSPLLNVDQFGRFMTVIKTLGARVEREHMEHLRAARQLEDQTAQFSQNNDVLNGYAGGLMATGGEVDFETLVSGGKAQTNGQQTSVGLDDPWSGEGWADSWAMDSATPAQTAAVSISTPASSTFSPPPVTSNVTSPRPPTTSSPSRLKARPIPASSFNTAAFPPAPAAFAQPLTPQVQPSPAQQRPSQSGPDYNISLAPQAPAASAYSTKAFPSPAPQAQGINMSFMQPQKTAVAPPPGWNPQSVLQPTVKSSFNPSAAKQVDWSDFDPLK